MPARPAWPLVCGGAARSLEAGAILQPYALLQAAGGGPRAPHAACFGHQPTWLLVLRAVCGKFLRPQRIMHRSSLQATRAMLQLGAHRRSRAFTKRAASAKTSPPRPAPQPDIITPTSVRPMRRCMTYSSAGSWSRVTQWMHSTGHVSMDSCTPRVGFR